MTQFTVYEYKSDGLYRPFGDQLLFTTIAPSLEAAEQEIKNRHPKANRVSSSIKTNPHYCSILKSDEFGPCDYPIFYNLL
jgi:hypothetical protein